MAGRGSRFAKLGYVNPKPLIPISTFGNIPMIEAVLHNMHFDAEYIFIVQEEHCSKYKLDIFLKSICRGCKVVTIDKITDGAVCTVLLAKQYINYDEPILIINSDQYIDWEKDKFIEKVSDGHDGCIFTFKTNNPNCSYVKLNNDGFVSEAVEKKVISDIGTVGIYYWNSGCEFLRYAEQMIKKNIRTNNEFYICPVYQEAINDGKKITTFDVLRNWSLGTPEDLIYFVDNYKRNEDV